MQRRALRWWVVGSTMALMVTTAAGPVQAADVPDPSRFTATGLTPSGEPINTPKSRSGQLAQSDPDLLNSNDSATTTVMVKLDYDAAAAYTGGVDGLAPTSPSVTGKALDENDPAVAGYLDYANRTNAEAASAITSAVPGAKVGQSYSVAYGGLSVTLPANQAKNLLAVPGVAAVQANALMQLDEASATPTSSGPANDTAEFIGATKVWPSLGGQANAGKGVVVGVLDTGIWPEHPMLADNGNLPAPAHQPARCDFGDGGDPALGPAFTCNNKLIGAYAFMDGYVANNPVTAADYCNPTTGVCSARDSEGHGTHTTTTAAGQKVTSAPLLGTDRGPISGIAPGAEVIAYRVCGPAGCYGIDSVAAVQQAILDGVNVINFSIGGGASAYSDAVELAFLDAYQAGITVSASAGNDGPGSSTAEHAGPWVLTVGASTSNRSFESTLNLTSSDGATFAKVGSTITAGVTGPVVQAANVAGYGDEYCGTELPTDSVTGKIVVCERGGGIGRVQKGYNALQGGAIGMILYNPTASDTETDNHFLPAIHLEGPNQELLDFLAAHPDVTASWATGTVHSTQGDVMAGFSSRGPVGDVLKPDITAPGVQILAGNTPTPTDVASGPPGQLYQAIAGTSMSSPHTAGASALIKAAHPNWTPGQIKSAQMTSSVQDVVNVDGSPAGVFDRGAGSLRVDRAVNPTATFDETADHYTASADDPLHRVDLNLPSIYVKPLPGAITVKRTLKNVSGRTQTFTASTTHDAGLRITVLPSTFTVPPGGTRTVQVTLDTLQVKDAPAGTFLQGQITLKPRSGATPVVLPVAAQPGDAEITLDQTCNPATVRAGRTVTCSVKATNMLPVPAEIKSLQTISPMLAQSVTGPARKTVFGASWSGTLSAAVAPTVTGIDPAESPAGGYLPLSAFGIAPIAGMGDESLIDFTVPEFRWGSETYTAVGVDSNGYLVVGGGEGADNDCCNPEIPNAARPNNVIAPYWTDLNPAAGGAVRIGRLSDGVTSWLVADWNGVPAYGSTMTNSFQVWIQLGTTEAVWMSYGALGGANGQDLVSGAENRDGTSGVKIEPAAAADTEYAVKTAPPTDGGSVTYSVTYRALWPGTTTVATVLRAPTVVRTTPIATNAITVTR